METIDLYLKQSTIEAIYRDINNPSHDWYGWTADRVVEQIVVDHLREIERN